MPMRYIEDIDPLRWTNPFNATTMDETVKRTKDELQLYLKKRGLRVSGKKAELLKRFKFSPKEIRQELSRRGLDSTGTEAEVRSRMEAHNRHLITLDGQYEVHLRKLADFKQSSLDKIVPFHYFPKFPVEICLMIWEFAVESSDPRVLTLRGKDHKLNNPTFCRDHNSDNPALLSTCHQSRGVTLKKYRLVFGTPNVYADLSIDILHLEKASLDSILFVNRRDTGTSGTISGQPASSSFETDLRITKNIALSTWSRYAPSQYNVNRVLNGNALRLDVQTLFHGIERLLLVQHHESTPRKYPEKPRSEFTPAYIGKLEKTQGDGYFQGVWNSISKDLSNPDLNTKPLKIEAAQATRVTKVPDEDWEHTFGEPYYPAKATINESKSEAITDESKSEE